MKKVIIIGGGIGGLSSAVRLLNMGYKVTIIEKENAIGGKINRVEKGGYKFDLTASILMTPHIYLDLFNDVKRIPKDYFDYIKLDNTYRVYYNDKTFYDFYNDENNNKMVLDKIDKNLSKDYYNLINNSYENYIIAKKDILNKPMISLTNTLKLDTIKDLLKIEPLNSSSDYIEDNIKNNKIREFLIFQSMYIGINPYNNSNIYTLIPAITQKEGLIYIKGGMYEYIMSLKKLITELGGKIYLNETVENIIIRNNKAVGVKTNIQEIYSDIIICNADYPYSIKNLINKDIKEYKKNSERIDKLDYSCSVFMLYLGLNKKYENIKLHNIYINENFKENMKSVFSGKIPKEPSLYIYSPSYLDNTLCKQGNSTINIMLRVPNLGSENIIWDTNTIKQVRNTIINTIKKINGLEDIEKNIEVEEYLTPKDLEKKYNAYLGCAFGVGHQLTQCAYLRPHLKSKYIKNLYYIGSSTHPGNGTSVIIEGSKVLVNIIENDMKCKEDDV